MDVLRNVQIPTVIVPKNHTFEAIKTIALAVDFKPLNDISIINPIVELARSTSAAVKAFHIQESSDDAMSTESTEVQKLFTQLEDVEHGFDNIHNDNVAAGIGRYMDDSTAEMLAIVARKHNVIERLFQKSITKEVSLLATFPLYVVREQ
jgi:K+-sensing histidine kinase KdpD